MSEAGKGSKKRPVNQQKFDNTYDKIFRSVEIKNNCCKQRCVNRSACSEAGYCILKTA